MPRPGTGSKAEPRRNGLGADAHGKSRSRSARGVVHVVASRNAKLRAHHVAFVRRDHELSVLDSAHDVGLDVGISRIGQLVDAAREREVGPDVRACVVGGIDRRAALGEGGDHESVFTGRLLDAPEELLMLALRVGKQRHGRTRPVGEPRHFAPVVHAALDHRTAVLEGKLQKHLGHADLVVEVAFGRAHALGAPSREEDRCKHLGRRGLAVAAGDDSERKRKASAPGLGRKPEGQPRVRDDDLGDGGVHLAFDDGAHGARLGRSDNKVVPVKTLARKRNEDISRLHRAGVRRKALVGLRKVSGRRNDNRLERFKKLLQAFHDQTPSTARSICTRRSLKASRTTSESLKWCLTPLIS